MSHDARKPILVSERVRYKLICTVSEEEYEREISNLISRGIVLPVSLK